MKVGVPKAGHHTAGEGAQDYSFNTPHLSVSYCARTGDTYKNKLKCDFQCLYSSTEDTEEALIILGTAKLS